MLGVRLKGWDVLVDEELPGEINVIVGVGDSSASLVNVGLHTVDTVVCLLFGQVL